MFNKRLYLVGLLNGLHSVYRVHCTTYYIYATYTLIDLVGPSNYDVINFIKFIKHFQNDMYRLIRTKDEIFIFDESR